MDKELLRTNAVENSVYSIHNIYVSFIIVLLVDSDTTRRWKVVSLRMFGYES